MVASFASWKRQVAGFLMQAPVRAQQTVTTGGRTLSLTHARDAQLTQIGNPLSLVSLDEPHTINGKLRRRVFNRATGTHTLTSPEMRVRTLAVDDQGRVLKASAPGLHPIRREYDSAGPLAFIKHGPDPDTSATRVTALAYKSTAGPDNGYLDTMTDPIGRVVQFAYDGAGRITSQTFLPGSPAQRVVAYTHDDNGNLEGVSPPGRPQHAFEYTPVNLRMTYIPPVLPQVPQPQTLYGYNLDRDLTSIARPDGRSASQVFDSETGRLESATLQPEGEVRGHTYSPISGYRTSLSTPDANLSVGYSGRLLSSETWAFVAPSVAHTVTHGYDNDFRRDSLQVDGLPAVEFQFDDDGLLSAAGALTLQLDPSNGLLQSTALAGSLVTATDTYAPSAFGELDAYSAAIDATAVYGYTIDERDKLGRIIRKTETIEGVSAQYQYGYDPAGRLADVWRVSTPAAHLAHYEYDGNGNRVSGFNQVSGAIAASSGASDGTRYDDQDRLIQYQTALDGVVGYAYTANGDLAGRTDGSGQTTYSYDAFGNLRTVALPGGSTIEYLIDGRNRRIGKRIDGNFVQGLLYKDRLEPVAELGSAGGVVAQFVYGSRSNVPDYMIRYGIDAGTYRIISDHLGSPRVVVNLDSGAIAQRLDYDEFGNVLLDTNPGLQPFGFAGGILDRDTSLVRYGARDYDPRAGRWTSKDPALFSGRDGNLYQYALGNPLRFLDSTGLTLEDVEAAWDLVGDVLGDGPGTFLLPGTDLGVDSEAGFEIAAFYDPMNDSVTFDDRYQKVLVGDDELLDLLLTAFHEWFHYKAPHLDEQTIESIASQYATQFWREFQRRLGRESCDDPRRRP
jgi:RHS repeat-associated protein